MFSNSSICHVVLCYQLLHPGHIMGVLVNAEIADIPPLFIYSYLYNAFYAVIKVSLRGRDEKVLWIMLTSLVRRYTDFLSSVVQAERLLILVRLHTAIWVTATPVPTWHRARRSAARRLLVNLLSHQDTGDLPSQSRTKQTTNIWSPSLQLRL